MTQRDQTDSPRRVTVQEILIALRGVSNIEERLVVADRLEAQGIAFTPAGVEVAE